MATLRCKECVGELYEKDGILLCSRCSARYYRAGEQIVRFPQCQYCGGELYKAEGFYICGQCHSQNTVELPIPEPSAAAKTNAPPPAKKTEPKSVKVQSQKEQLEKQAAKLLSTARQLMDKEVSHDRTKAYDEAADFIKPFYGSFELPNKWEVLFFPEYCRVLDLLDDRRRTYSREDIDNIRHCITWFLNSANFSVIKITADVLLSHEDVMRAHNEVAFCSLEVIWLMFARLSDHLSKKNEDDAVFVSFMQYTFSKMILGYCGGTKDEITSHAILQSANEAFNRYFKLKDPSKILDVNLPALSLAEKARVGFLLSDPTDRFWENNAALKSELLSERTKLRDAQAEMIEAKKAEFQKLEKEYQAKETEYKKTSFLHPYKLDRLEKEMRAISKKKRTAEDEYIALKGGHGKMEPILKKINGINQILDTYYPYYKGPMARVYLDEIKEQLEKIKKM